MILLIQPPWDGELCYVITHSIPIGSMGRFVYLPTFTIRIDHLCIGKYAHGSYRLIEPYRTLLFGGGCTPQSSSDKPIGSPRDDSKKRSARKVT